jgi:FkbM family methyltransferase
MSWNKFFVKNFYKFKGHIDLSVHGLDLKGDPENYHFWQSCSRGDWEPNTFKLLKEFLNSESIFLDIGAWIGPLSVFASKLCGQVYSFEPDQFAFRKLVENILLNDSKNIHAISAALSNANGIRTMTPQRERLGDSSSSLINNSGEDSKFIYTPCIEIQSIITDLGHNFFDLIKVDIEGGEAYIFDDLLTLSQNFCKRMLFSSHSGYFDGDEKLAYIDSFLNLIKTSRVYSEDMQLLNEKGILDMENATGFNSYVIEPK